MPSISAIIPTYNYGRFIADAVASVLEQTCPPDEIIVVDHGSTDNTAEVLARFGDRIRVVHETDESVASARNTGVAQSTGDFLAFLDADDVWLPRKLEMQLRRFQEQSDLGLVHTGVLLVDDARTPLKQLLDGMEGSVATEMLLFQRHVILGGGSGMMVSRRAYDAVGGFDKRIFTEDWDFWYRVARRFRVGFVPEVLLHSRFHARNRSRSLMKRERSMLLIYEQAFRDPDPALQRLRRRAYGNLHLGLAGWYMGARQPRHAMRHVIRSLWLNPRNALRLITYPVRHVRRLANERPIVAAPCRTP